MRRREAITLLGERNVAADASAQQPVLGSAAVSSIFRPG